MFTEMLKKNGLLTNRIFVSLLLLVLIACVPGTPAVTPPPVTANLDPPGGRATYDIGGSVADRYGIDANGNGVVDMPNTVEYVQRPLRVTLNANSLAKSYPSKWPYENTESAGFYSIQGPWRWTLTPNREGAVPQGLSDLPTPTSTTEGYSGLNDGQKIVTYSDEPMLTIDLFEGEWAIELARMNTSGNAVYWKTADVHVTDFLIVQLGDSYSSGEGAPDRDSQGGYWGDDGTGQNGEHVVAHRSSNTWGSVVASHLEAFSPSASVTFINLAVSGALIEDVRAQLDRLSTLVGVRRVDAVLISIGGNDAGFENVIVAYLLREPIDNFPDLGPSLDLIEEAIRTGNWTHSDFTDIGGVLLEQFNIDVPWLYNRRGLNGLKAGYEDVANAFAEHGINPAVVYTLQYPDPFVADPTHPDTVCPGPVLTSVSGFLGRRLEIGREEQRHARDHFVVPLNQQIAASAEALGWQLVEAERVMYGHAICQGEGERMIVRYEESQNLQGDRKGTLHPNKIGYEAIAVPALNAVFAGEAP